MIYQYSGKEFNLPGPILKSIDISSETQVVIVEPEELPPAEKQKNMFLLHKDGQIVWTVEAVFPHFPTLGYRDYWIDIEVDDDGALRADYTRGFECIISLADGKVIERKFTK